MSDTKVDHPQQQPPPPSLTSSVDDQIVETHPSHQAKPSIEENQSTIEQEHSHKNHGNTHEGEPLIDGRSDSENDIDIRGRSPLTKDEHYAERNRRRPGMNEYEYEQWREKERERQNTLRKKRQEKNLPVNKKRERSQIEEENEILNNFKQKGVYIPPHKMRKIQNKINDPKSVEYQRLNWENLKKSINGLVNKVNKLNIKNILHDLFNENIIRGRGLFARCIIKSQSASLPFTNVYAALVSVINTKMPEIGELVLKRLIVTFSKSYRRNDKVKCIACCNFIAHLINQQVCHEILGGQILGLLLEKPSDDSVELAIQFIKECGQTMNQVAPKIVYAVFDRFRTILHQGKIDKRVQYMIEALFLVRKRDFSEYPAVVSDLDLIDFEDQITHELELDDTEMSIEAQLDYFHFDSNFEQNEAKYKQIKKQIIGEEEESDESDNDESGDESGEDKDDVDSDNEGGEQISEAEQQKIEKQREIEIIEYKKKVYLVIVSSLDFQECAHKIIKQGLIEEGREMEFCSLIVESCSREKTFLKFYGLLAERFCQLYRICQQKFEQCFTIQYSMIHRLETNRLRNVAKLFSHLLCREAISWTIFNDIRITQADTTSSSRIFIKVLFQEIMEHIGINKLAERMKDEYLKPYYQGLFPVDHTKNTRFAINFWTAIGLGVLTEDMRQFLKEQSKMMRKKRRKTMNDSSDDSDSGDSDSDDSSSDSDSE